MVNDDYQLLMESIPCTTGDWKLNPFATFQNFDFYVIRPIWKPGLKDNQAVFERLLVKISTGSFIHSGNTSWF